MIHSRENLEAYRNTLLSLRAYLDELAIDESPDDSVTIMPGTEGSGRPIGARLPIFSPEQCGIDEEGMKKVYFNLQALIGFDPRKK